METQELFNTMMENAIVYLQEKGYISKPSQQSRHQEPQREPDFGAMVKGLRESGDLPNK